MSNVKNIMIVGVGGQGTLLASRLLGNALMRQNYDVKVSEVHGMSQRGGSVVTYIKYGDKVYSPVIDLGEADIIISFEQLEAARWLCYLKKGGKMLVNTQQISPMPVITGSAKYPENLISKIEETGCDITAFDALSLAEQAGSSKAVNVVLIGALSNLLGFERALWHEVISECVPAKFLDLNQKAFELGANISL